MVLAFLALATLPVLTGRPFLPADERAHTGYALLVGEGELPTPTPPIPGIPPPSGQRLRVYTANHPPLYYALVAAPLRLGEATRHPLVVSAAALLLAAALAMCASALPVLAAGEGSAGRAGAGPCLACSTAPAGCDE